MNTKDITVRINCSIIDALKEMDRTHHKSLIVFDDKGNFYSILTIGEIQRAIIRNVDMHTPVGKIVSTSDKEYAFVGDSKEKVKEKILKIRAEWMPVLDQSGHLVDLYQWSDFFGKKELSEGRELIDLPVVIMAGGKGTRLSPLTKVIPKPLIPIGDKTILEEIMDRFEEIGCHRFFMSVNYKSDMMRFYMNQLEHKYEIEFFSESKPLGTIGSVALLKGKLDTPFFVSNCDIIIDQDFRDVYQYHIDNRNDLTIITAIKSFKIPYGVIETGEDGLMTGLKEKPETTYMINTGVYLLNPETIAEIPEDTFFHITDLMEKIKALGGRVGCFPVSEHAWSDMGEWPEYLKMIKVL